MRENRAAFERLKILPRMLRDVSSREIGIELFGRRLPAPLLLAPIGVLEEAHPEADLAVSRAAAADSAVGGGTAASAAGLISSRQLPLGARAVCIGRAYAYGLAVAGEPGVVEVVENLLADFELTMALSGCREVREIDRSVLRPG